MLRYFIRKNKRGQSIIEYIVVITVFLFAWFGFAHYFKRGLSGRWKSVVDDLGDQYDPRITTSSVRHTIKSETNTFVKAVPVSRQNPEKLYTEREDFSKTEEKKFGSESIGAY